MADNDTHDLISKLHAIGENIPYGGKEGAKFYLQSIDDRVKDLDKNKNDLQDGNYLLFVLNKNGTPSEGKIFYIN